MAAAAVHKMRPTSTKRLTNLARGVENRHFPLSVRLVDTGELFPLESIGLSTTVDELKSYLEYATGIPVFMQRLHYLDEGDLQDGTDVRSNDIVPGGCLHLNVWHTWSKLIIAAVHGDVDEVFSLGVTANSDYRTPNSEYMSSRMRQSWLQERAFVALYIASHRGHVKLVQKLVQSGANVNRKTTLGRSPLHVAASQDRGDIVDVLLNSGADVNALDGYDESALDVAEKFGHKDGARHLFLFQWQVRAANAKKVPEAPMFLHQLCDTSFPIWHNGTQGQLYFAQVLPPGEFSGTGLGAKRRLPLSPIAGSTLADAAGERADGAATPGSVSKQAQAGFSKADDFKDKKMAFEEWLKRKQKVEQVRLDKLKAEEELKKLEEAKKKEQSLIDKESYEMWVKKQQEEKSLQEKAEKKKAAAKKLQPQAGAQRLKAGAGAAAIGGALLAAGGGSQQVAAELEAIDAHREVQELKRFIEKKWRVAAVAGPQVGGYLAGADDDGGIKPDGIGNDSTVTALGASATAAGGATISKAAAAAVSKKKLRESGLQESVVGAQK